MRIYWIEDETRRMRMSGAGRGKVWPVGHWRGEPEKKEIFRDSREM